jgi:competence protein ComEC
MMRPPTGFLLSSAFILGVALTTSNLFLPLFALLGGLTALFAIWSESRQVLILGGACLLLIVAGGVRVATHSESIETTEIPDGPSQFVGVVADVPAHYPTASYSRVDLAEPEDVRVWTQLPAYPEVRQGDVVRFDGVFQKHSSSSHYSAAIRQETAGSIDAQRVNVLGNQASTPQQWRTLVAGEIRARLRDRVPEPAGAFATGVLLGDDGAMTETTRHAFRVGGLTHMTAVSGVHVGIIAAVFLLLSRLGFVSRWFMLAASVPVIWMFAYLVGLRPSVVRASIMLTLLIIAHFLGRPRDTLNAVGLAAALMLAIDPANRLDVGFQLSVAATVGIAIGILLVGSRSHWHLIWVVPVSAQLATEPLILYHFGYYSLISPVANILATPFLAATMAMSLLTVASSFVSEVTADALAIGTWIPAMAVVLIADWAASVHLLTDEIRSLTLAQVWSAYVVLGGFIALLFLVFSPDPSQPDHEYSWIIRV